MTARNSKGVETVLKAMLALGALAAVTVGLVLPAPAHHAQPKHFLQAGVQTE
jgi:hypothetical protein